MKALLKPLGFKTTQVNSTSGRKIVTSAERKSMENTICVANSSSLVWV